MDWFLREMFTRKAPYNPIYLYIFNGKIMENPMENPIKPIHFLSFRATEFGESHVESDAVSYAEKIDAFFLCHQWDDS